MTWHAQLAHEEHVERRFQPGGHFIGDRHAASRETEHDHIRPAGILRQLFGQPAPGIGPVAKTPRFARAAHIDSCYFAWIDCM
jgi:hypothetical protein